MITGTRKNLTIILICGVFLATAVPARSESIVMKYVGKWVSALFPNAKEIAWVSNSANALYQVGALARSSLALVNRFRDSYDQLIKTKELIEQTFEDIQALYYNFDPYDIDNWAATLRGAQRVIDYDCYGALYAWGAVEFVAASAHFALAIDSLVGDHRFRYRHKRNRDFVDQYYFDPKIDSLRTEYARVVGGYAEITMNTIDHRIVELRNAQIGASKAEQDRIQSEINTLEAIAEKFYDQLVSVAINHDDTLMNFIRDLVVFNLTDIHVIEEKISDYETAADRLVELFYDLKSNQQSASLRTTTKIYGDSAAVGDSVTRLAGEEEVYGEGEDIGDPHRVPRPPQSAVTSSGRTMTRTTSFAPPFGKKRRANLHDVIHLQNAIDFILLQQEMLLRELAVLKGKSMAAMVAAEAYDHHSVEVRGLYNLNMLLDMED